jgi:PqqA peptide cyclase
MEHRPYTLVAELTYRCPLKCPYCSNPLAMNPASEELSTQDWVRVLGEVAALGVLQVHFTGGEPLARTDLEELVQAARKNELYTNLITSGIPLSRERLRALKKAGIDNVQVSLQDVEEKSSNNIAGTPSHAHKLEVAEWVKAEGLPLTLNTVLHRQNLDRVEEIIALAEDLKADRLELANTQYHGWAMENRGALIPTPDQLASAKRVVEAAKARLAGKLELVYVMPDYFSKFPKACMDGWARRYLVISPKGLALPCHSAHTIKGMTFENVQEKPLEDIWNNSPSFNMYRGDAWMQEPCRTCPKKDIDFGGCRCQAFHLAGDAAATDPACSLSPHHGLVTDPRDAIIAKAKAGNASIPFVYRVMGRKT